MPTSVLFCCFGSVNIYYFSNVKICAINSKVKDRKGVSTKELL